VQPAPLPVEPPFAFQSTEPDCANVVPLRVGGGIQPPKVLRRVDPLYPPSMQDVEIQGIGIFEVILNEQGRVCSIRVLRGLLPRIDQAVVEAVCQWTFSPPTRKGRPVAVAYVITVNVDLRRP
jgi:TonB family protein